MYVQLPGGFILPWRTKILSESRQVGQSWGWKWSFLVWYLVTSVQCLCSVVLGTPTSSKDLKIFIFIIQYPSTEGLNLVDLKPWRFQKVVQKGSLFESHSLFFFLLYPRGELRTAVFKKDSHGFLLFFHIILNIEKSHAILRTKKKFH